MGTVETCYQVVRKERSENYVHIFIIVPHFLHSLVPVQKIYPRPFRRVGNIILPAPKVYVGDCERGKREG